MGLHDLWYENAILYCLDVETYADSDGDGVGDFRGLISRLDYLSGLGITCIWLMPFYPTAHRDDGYDVMDYCAVDPRYGTIADFAEFVLEARERGMHVIIDLVPNHSSDQHPWFQSARSSPDSPFRDYYVWRTDDPGDTSDQVVFPGEQEGIWTWDEQAQAYYLHHFLATQPDLNFANPAVREEFRRIVGLWLQLGVDGFRIDAAPFLINLIGVEAPWGLEEAHQYLRELQEFVAVRSGNAILLGEVDVAISALADYFGGGNELHSLFNFPLNRFLFLGLALGSSDPIRFGLSELPSVPARGQWVNFLRHHDELNLSRLTKVQREEVYAAFGPEPGMQIYNRGLRRRLAPMFAGDVARLKMAYSVLFSLPGAPMVFYGEEIGMGENLAVPGRLSVRTPMQWAPFGSGGFSEAAADALVRPMPEGEYGIKGVSVARQRSDPDSLLNMIEELMRTRRECPAVGTGEWSALETGQDAVLALRHDVDGTTTVVLNNMGPKRCTVLVDLTVEECETAIDLLGDRRYDAIDPQTRTFQMSGYGYRWVRIGGGY